MLVSKILSEVRPAYCETWDEVFAYFNETPHERKRIDELKDEITINGQKEPGLLRFDDEDNYYYLGNGTHRFAATVELGLTDYPVTEEVEDYGVDESSYKMVNVDLWITVAAHDKYKGTDEDFSDCFMSSLSFRVNDDCWAEICTVGGRGNSNAVEYNISFYDFDVKHIPEFAEKFLERISCCVKAEDILSLDISATTHFEKAFWATMDKDK